MIVKVCLIFFIFNSQLILIYNNKKTHFIMYYFSISYFSLLFFLFILLLVTELMKLEQGGCTSIMVVKIFSLDFLLLPYFFCPRDFEIDRVRHGSSSN